LTFHSANSKILQILIQTTNKQPLTKANTMFEQLLDQAKQANSAEARYLQTGDITALDESITVWEWIVQHPDFAILKKDFRLKVLNNSAITYWYRYGARGELVDLDKALSAWQTIVTKTPPESPYLPGLLNNLGNGLRDRYTREGDISDLQAGIEAYQQAVQLTPAGSSDLPGYLNNQGLGLTDRYARTGDLTDLQAGIAAYQQAVQLTPAGSPDLPSILNNLGNGLTDRYARTGDLTDLQAGIEAYQQAVQLTPAGLPELPSRLNNLGGGLRVRYARTGDLTDLQAGIAAYQQAVQLTPEGSPSLPSILNNLGNGLTDHYARTGDLTDLQTGIEAYQRAAQLTLEGSPHLPGILNNLGTGWRDRYARTGNLTDLQEGIVAFQRAVQLTPERSPNVPGFLNNQGTGLTDRYAHTGDMSDLQAGIEVYQQAAQRGLEVALEDSLKSARNWLRWAFKRQAWQEVTQAYCYAYEAGQRLFKSQLLRTHKESWLKEMQGLASQAAYAFTKLNQLEKAVVALERGIARLLSEALQRDRANLEQLKTTGHTDLYDRYQEIVGRYHWAQQQQKVDALKTAQADLDKTIEDIRQVPGYEHFLKSVEFDLIQAAAQETPLVYILTTSAGGLALIVKEKEITPVWLPNLEDTFAGYWEAYIQWRNTPTNENLRHHWHTTIETTTQQLWTAVMQPLMNALPPDIHHLTLIPVGRLNLLPWHAAWTEEANSRSYALDKLTIAYAPNAVTVTQCQQWAKLTTVPKLLAVSEPHPQPPTAESLHYSRYATPAICSLFPDNTQQLASEQATVENVTAQLREAHTLWYFYCHGLTNFEEPLKSGLLLAGSQPQFLTLGDVLNLKVTGVRLATLAACETNIPDLHKLPDEVVSLAAGLLQAGVAGVIASLWSVDAVSTAFLMVRCYDILQQRWQTDGNMQAPLVTALQDAQRWLRNSTKRELQEWIDQRQLRQHLDLVQQTELDDWWYDKADEYRPFAAPYYWAAFVGMGY
jgi:CHAT domain-containing protein